MGRMLGVVAVFGCLALLLAPVQAQQRSGSAAGSRGSGGTLSAGARSAIGGTGRGAAGGGAAGVGTGGLNSMSSIGQVNASDRFVRGSRQAGSFVGTGSEDLAGFVGDVDAGASSGNRGRSSSGLSSSSYGQGNSRNGNSGRGRSGRQGYGQRGADEISASLRLGFQAGAATVDVVGGKITARLEKLAAIQKLSPLTVTVVDGTAILRGVVATDHDRDLAERLALLEGGVWQVKNELLLGSQTIPPSPSELPLSSPVPVTPQPPAPAPALAP